jgi:hypothetical protein
MPSTLTWRSRNAPFMRITQKTWREGSWWDPVSSGNELNCPQLVLVFGGTAILRKSQVVQQIRQLYPTAHIFGCSTAGEICGSQVSDDSIVVTAVQFEHTQIRAAETRLDVHGGSEQAGAILARALPHSIPGEDGAAQDPLMHVLILSDGLSVNGSDLVAGLTKHLPAGVSITGGLAGDGARFGETFVFREGLPEPRSIAALGLYGTRLIVGCGSLGGWHPFGPERLVTRSVGNVLFELDGRPALLLYKQYLGEHAAGLPATGMLFPLSVRTRPHTTPLLRTILAVDESQQSMTFAGDIPGGAYARLTKSNIDRLVDGAIGAARASVDATSVAPQLAILISCIGRKLVLKQRVEEEVEAVHEALGEQTTLAGFYSYGEIAPFSLGGCTELHNQTMTITTFAEF